MESFNELMADLADHIGLDKAELLQTQEIAIDNFVVGFQADEDPTVKNLIFFTLLGVPSPEKLNQIAITLLEANNLWAGTSGCTLGLQQESRAVILAGNMPINLLTGQSLAVVLEQFINVASFWQQYIQGTVLHNDSHISQNPGLHA
jgi:hypothetical protein